MCGISNDLRCEDAMTSEEYLSESRSVTTKNGRINDSSDAKRQNQKFVK